MSEIAKSIDHTALKPETTYRQIEELCAEAILHGFYSVCVNGCHVARCRQRLEGTPVKVCGVVGFPLGAMSREVKGEEAARCIKDGACEVDMVINVGALKSGDLELVELDIREVVVRAKSCNPSAIVKVIIETSLLSDSEKVTACRCAEKAGADFVKTSTGFNGDGATVEDVRLMRASVGAHVQVKASGGVRDQETALKMLEAGATRLGTSSSVKIVKGAAPEKGAENY